MIKVQIQKEIILLVNIYKYLVSPSNKEPKKLEDLLYSSSNSNQVLRVKATPKESSSLYRKSVEKAEESKIIYEGSITGDKSNKKAICCSMGGTSFKQNCVIF